MRIATVGGVLMLLAGCNALPAENVNGEDQNLSGGAAGAGTSDTKTPDKTKNETAAADAAGPSDCELKAKACYAESKDPQACDAILKSCTPPQPQPGCGEDCDSSVRACFAKGIDAKTCDAQYHACLGSAPGSGSPANDPVADCELAAKQCFADPNTPAEKCQALLDSCTPPPPSEDPAVECKLEYVKCLDAKPDAGSCEAALDACIKAASAKAPN